ncbi:hypothetical protein AN641_09165 [Candidatus Epulonipiscioides gigas]|nr:hypothetical protein AN641_09165 [Epulopiscium sp. SCG-C07WGA-EpuloA2]
MQIGIIGLGLIGGSIAKTLKQINAGHSDIVAFDNNIEVLNKAKEEGIINKISPAIGSEFSDCNVIFICTPVADIVSIVNTLLKYVSRDYCIITDVGSTKYNILKEVNPLLKNKNVFFIGGHPMTGSEKSGYDASTDYLFENAYYVLTPFNDTPEFIIFILQKVIERLGAIPIIIPSDVHDKATATISHVPHIIASALVNLVKHSDTKERFLHTLAAGGFKDITRIASADPIMWENISFANKEEITKVIEHFINILNSFKDSLELDNKQKIFDFFEEAKLYRNTFRDGIHSTFVKTYTMFIDVKDYPGSIASVATLLSNNSINIRDIGIVNHREFEAGILRIVFSTEDHRLKAHELLLYHNYKVYY